jgi:phage tail-like protein
MKVLSLRAEPADGGCIRLSWQTPAEAAFRGVRVLRRQGRFPTLDDLGSPAEVFHDADTPAQAAAAFLDGPLQGETVYYYTVVAYDGADRRFPAVVSALAPTPFQTDAYLFRNLPEIYQLFDRDAGAVRRLTALLAQPLELVRSFTGAMRDLHDVDRVEGALLPLLAQWIGQPPDTTLGLDRQRNEIRYAPAHHRTTGIAANLRAAINRFVSWDTRFKEFVHNVFLVTHPEELRLWELRQRGTLRPPPAPLSFDVAHEGRAATLLDRDGRSWIVYQARRSAPAAAAGRGGAAGADGCHLYAKIEDRDQMLPAVRLSFGDGVHKHPAVVQRADGAIWLFSAGHTDVGGRLVPGIRLQLVAVGRPAAPAQALGTAAGPFTLADGEDFQCTVIEGASSLTRRVVVREENVPGFPTVSAADAARLLDAELPGVDARATPQGTLQLRTRATGAAAVLNLPASPLATRLGLAAGVSTGGDATRAVLTGARAQPFALQDEMTLTVRVDHEAPRTMTFDASEFADVAQATAAEVAAAIELRMPGVAEVAGASVRLRSPTTGAGSVIAVLVDESTAAPALGLGAPLPAPPAAGTDEDEPTACVDAGQNVWLFWSSRRTGAWKIWYARSDGLAWAAPKPLTGGARPDREPFALFDPAAARLWVFWTRKAVNGLRNVVSRTTTNLDFPALTDAAWSEREHTPAPATFENREPAAALGAAGAVDVYFASNRADGWNVWTRPVTVAGLGPEVAVTTGQSTRRAPAPLRSSATDLRLFFRSNEGEVYRSSLFPTATTIDNRYSGSTVLDLRNATKISLRGNLQDLQRYTYDTRPEPTDTTDNRDTGLFARNKVGVFLTPDTDDQQLILRQSHLFANALRRCLPIQVQVVFLIDLSYTEPVYGYEHPDLPGVPLIGEQVVDTILSEVLPPGADGFSDAAPAVRFLRTWPAIPALPDLAGGLPPGGLPIRLYTKRFQEGE